MKIQILFYLNSILFAAAQEDGGIMFRPKPETPKPWVKMTQGEIWPKPKFQKSSPTYLIIDPKEFHMKLDAKASNCDILVRSLSRFESRIFPGDTPRSNRRIRSPEPLLLCLDRNVSADCDPNFAGILLRLTVSIKSDEDCSAYPYLNMDESYQLIVDQPGYESEAHIEANSVWGALRGMESFSQLIYNTHEHHYQYQLNSTYIEDAPRFSHRGVLLDSSRHYLSKKVLKLNLDLMEMNKFNVFHWHLTDHTAFPYQSRKFPKLSEFGAYDPETHVYTQDDVRMIVEEAKLRGIRVIPEFDTPGHTKSWEPGQPGLLAQCEDPQTGKPLEEYGPIDPTKQSTFNFLAEFFDEITRVFPDKYVHIGGDEVEEGSCWSRNANIRRTMHAWNMTNFKELESFYIDTLFTILEKLPTPNGQIVWQEVFDNHDRIRPDTIIQVWIDWGVRWRDEIFKVTKAGYQAVLSAPWYLDSINYGADWVKFYRAEPMSFGGNNDQKQLLIGGEVCLWGEFVNSVNVIPRLWPRGSAAGEKLWSTFDEGSDIFSKEVIDDAARRLQEHECRMLARGYPVQPVVGAGYCPVHWDF